MAFVWSTAGLVGVDDRRRLRFPCDQRRSHFRAGREERSERRLRVEPRRRKGNLVESAGIGRHERSRIRTARHSDARRRSRVRADRARRSRVSESGRRRGGVAQEHPQRVQRTADSVADQRVAARRRHQRHRLTRRSPRGHRRARQDDRQDGVDQSAVERRSGLRVADRGGRAGRAHLHDAHVERRRRRARVGRPVDVALRAGRQRHGERRHADLSRQQSVLHVQLRNRRRVARPHRAERRGEGAADLLHARDAEPSRRRRARRRLPVWLQ